MSDVSYMKQGKAEVQNLNKFRFDQDIYLEYRVGENPCAWFRSDSHIMEGCKAGFQMIK